MSMPENVTIDAVSAADAAELVAIYNHYVRTSTVTFDLDEWSVDDMLHKIDAVAALGMPFIVARSEGHSVGYGYSSQWRDKCAFNTTVENTIYVDPRHIGQGIGRNLLGELLAHSTDAGAREMIAVIANTEDAAASIALHRRFGFTEVGRMDRVGFKFDTWLGVVMLQKSLTKYA